MAASPHLLLLTGRDAAADRAVLAQLVAYQRDTPVAGLSAFTAAGALAPLEACRSRHLGVAEDAKPWRRVADALVASALSQPPVALWPLADGPGRAGPLTWDITLLLGAAALDERVAIDLAVRWWQAARAAGLPVDADFGECWRAIEWLLLWQALAALGEPGEPAPAALAPAALAQAVRVALRYGALKPLLPLLQPLTGAAPEAGYTF